MLEYKILTSSLNHISEILDITQRNYPIYVDDYNDYDHIAFRSLNRELG